MLKVVTTFKLRKLLSLAATNLLFSFKEVIFPPRGGAQIFSEKGFDYKEGILLVRNAGEVLYRPSSEKVPDIDEL